MAVAAPEARRRFDLSVYLVTDTRLSGPRGIAAVAAAAARGGVTIVQLRDPDATTRELITAARALQAALAPHGVKLVINDRVDVALAVEADGVHLGDRDMPAATARRLLGPGCIVGVTVHDAAEARAVDTGRLPIMPASARSSAPPPRPRRGRRSGSRGSGRCAGWCPCPWSASAASTRPGPPR